jgi:hypothetical protein
MIERWIYKIKMEYLYNSIALPNGKLKCKICGKEFSKMGMSSHFWRSHGEGKNHNPNIGFETGERKIWNKGLNKNNDIRVRKGAEKFSKKIKSGEVNRWKGKKHKEKTKQIISKKLSQNNHGGRCKWFKVQRIDGKEFNVQGTWERDFTNVLNIIDKDWIKIGIGDSNHTFEWKDENDKIHHYTPDFWSPKLQKYFEIKGYWWGKDKMKMKMVLEQNNINLEIIRKKELKSYLKLIGG